MNQSQSIERTALSNLISNEDYARKVIPFLKGDYFKVREDDGKINSSGTEYVFMCFAESPFVNSEGVPVNAR